MQQSHLGIGGFTFEKLLILPRLVEVNTPLLPLLFLAFLRQANLIKILGTSLIGGWTLAAYQNRQNLEVFPVFAKTHTK